MARGEELTGEQWVVLAPASFDYHEGELSRLLGIWGLHQDSAEALFMRLPLVFDLKT
jgi:hypothetical protein